MKSKFQAFLVHLAISVLVALLSMLVVFRLWYPAPLDKLVGVGTIFLIVIGVDVIIGPILTFIVFKQGKRSLRFDLSVIVLLQIAAFCYGIWTVAIGRPVWIVFNVDRFDLVQAYDIDTRRLDRAAPEHRNASWLGPRWVYAESPTEIEARNTLTLEAALAGIDLPQRPDLYQPIESAHIQLKQRALPIEQLKKFNPESAVDEIKRKWPNANAYLPLMTKLNHGAVLIDKEVVKIIGIAAVAPWK